jgi:hypothetical protein
MKGYIRHCYSSVLLQEDKSQKLARGEITLDPHSICLIFFPNLIYSTRPRASCGSASPGGGRIRSARPSREQAAVALVPRKLWRPVLHCSCSCSSRSPASSRHHTSFDGRGRPPCAPRSSRRRASSGGCGRPPRAIRALRAGGRGDPPHGLTSLHRRASSGSRTLFLPTAPRVASFYLVPAPRAGNCAPSSLQLAATAAPRPSSSPLQPRPATHSMLQQGDEDEAAKGSGR